MRIRGTKYYSALDCYRAGTLELGTPLLLLPEPSNRHDRNAVRIVSSESKRMLGYAPRILAPLLKQAIESNNYECSISFLANTGDCIDIYCDIAISQLFNSPTKNLPDEAAVYAVVNLLNMRLYIGATNNLKKRWSEHVARLQSNSHFSPHLQDDWSTAGQHCFTVVQIERGVDYKELLLKEKEYINGTASFSPLNGYNHGGGRDQLHFRGEQGRVELSPAIRIPLALDATEKKAHRIPDRITRTTYSGISSAHIATIVMFLVVLLVIFF